eukprot:4801847-Pyramimonas_sp.AAC.1
MSSSTPAPHLARVRESRQVARRTAPGHRFPERLRLAILSLWMSIFGPLKTEVVDGERGILAFAAQQSFDRRSTRHHGPSASSRPARPIARAARRDPRTRR